MRKYKSLLNQADLRQLRELADRYHELENELRELQLRQSRISRLKFENDCAIEKCEQARYTCAHIMQKIIWRGILAPDDY